MTWPFTWPSRLTKYSRYMPGLHIEHAYKEFKFVYVIDPNVTDFITVEDFDHWCQVNFCYFFGDTLWYTRWENRWESNSIGGIYAIVICTNSEDSAIMAQLTFKMI